MARLTGCKALRAASMHVHCTCIEHDRSPAWKLQGRSSAMTKKPFTTRLDEEILELAHRLAEADRRSVTMVIELAVLEYADRRGMKPESVTKDKKG